MKKYYLKVFSLSLTHTQNAYIYKYNLNKIIINPLVQYSCLNFWAESRNVGGNWLYSISTSRTFLCSEMIEWWRPMIGVNYLTAYLFELWLNQQCNYVYVESRPKVFFFLILKMSSYLLYQFIIRNHLFINNLLSNLLYVNLCSYFIATIILIKGL